jgi:hypothetical protein
MKKDNRTGFIIKLGLKLPTQLDDSPDRVKRKEAKAAIDQLPVKRNAPNRTADQRQGKDTEVDDNPRVNISKVTHRILGGGYKEERDEEMSKGQPIRAVGDERIFLISCFESLSDKQNPMGQTCMVFRVPGGIRTHLPLGKKVQLAHERERGHTR